MLHFSHPVMILRATAGADLPEIGMKQGDTFYMVRDEAASTGPNARFRVVQWHLTLWVCSCGKGRCEHKLLVNEWVFAQSQGKPKPIPADDLFAHVEDDLRTHRPL